MAFTLLSWAWAKVAEALEEEKNLDAWHQSQNDYAQFGIEWLLDEGRLAWKRVVNKEAALPWL